MTKFSLDNKHSDLINKKKEFEELFPDVCPLCGQEMKVIKK